MQSKVRNRKRSALEARQRRTARSIARSARPRLTVYRSAKHIYAMLVDPVSGKTIGSVSTRAKSVTGATGNVEAAGAVGKAIAEVAKKNNIEEVVFNRNGFLYHGRVKALAEAARESGLRF